MMPSHWEPALSVGHHKCMSDLAPFNVTPLMLLSPLGVPDRLLSSVAEAPPRSASVTLRTYEEQIRQLQDAAVQVGPGARALQLQAHAYNLARDPTLLAAHAAVQAEQYAESARRALQLEQASRRAEQDKADAARMKADREAREIVGASQARVDTLRAKVAVQAQHLRDLNTQVDREERERQDLGKPMLIGAVAVTRVQTEKFKQDEEQFAQFAHDSFLIIAELERRTADLESNEPQLHQVVTEQESRLAAQQVENSQLIHRLARMQAIEEEILAASASDVASLSAEEDRYLQRAHNSCNVVNDLQARVTALRAEKDRLRSARASTESRFRQKFSGVFGDLDADLG